ncbi:MAG: toprim domain-containing protein [Cyclobacteriaceae bacterium]
MEISDIKQQLPLSQVLDYYGLKPDKHMKLHCPFHDDKTPSFQVYYKTQTCYCFSANCSTNGKSLDVIDFILHMEKGSKHEAIKKAKSMISGTATANLELTRVAVLTKMFTYFQNAVYNSKPAKEYIESRYLDHEKIAIGYNSGQFHHGSRRDTHLIDSCLKYGLLLDKNLTSARTREKAYSPFGKGCIVFPLKDKQGQIVSLYFRSIYPDNKVPHLYLRDRQGLYPNYPSREARHLIITECIIDAATLLQQKDITEKYEILALYGTNGLTAEHTEVIKELKELEEIILFLDGDEAGRKAATKYKKVLKDLKPNTQIQIIDTPEGEDINSLLDGHSSKILRELIASEEKERSAVSEKRSTSLNTQSPNNLIYQGQAAQYQIKGFNQKQLDSLKVTLQIIHNQNDHRGKCDLYEYRQTSTLAKQAAERLQLEKEEIENDLSQLTNLLEQYRANNQEKNPAIKQEIQVPQATQTQCLELLKSPTFFVQLNELIGKAGVIGEDENRLLLFVIASTYKMEDTLHALVQGSSGSGKTHLITKISELMPSEHTIPLTRVTESSFYNYGENELCNRLIILEDLDGLKEEAFLAFRELQSRGMLNSSTSVKDEQGNISAMVKTVKGPIASLSATTKGEVYEDNMSRCLVIAVDESSEQTANIIKVQNQLAEGKINREEQKRVTTFVQNCMRLIKPYEVVNPFASKVQLPEEAHKIRRLNQLYQAFVKQITLLHQYQRSRDKQGRLISEKEDLRLACQVLFECIVLKVDELDGSLRDFFEALKKHLKNEQETFTQREIRQALNMSKAQCSRLINQLLEMEYLTSVHAGNQRKVRYQIDYWDNYSKMREQIKVHLQNQIEKMEQ